MAHGGGATLRWIGPRQLAITYPAWADVERRCATAGALAFTYLTRAEPDSAWGSWARTEWQNHAHEPPHRRGGRGLTLRCS